MSLSGTHPEYESGWDDGFDEGAAKYAPLVTACNRLLSLWAKNKNLTVPAQAIHAALLATGDRKPD
jgi:hypothetical protein